MCLIKTMFFILSIITAQITFATQETISPEIQTAIKTMALKHELFTQIDSCKTHINNTDYLNFFKYIWVMDNQLEFSVADALILESPKESRTWYIVKSTLSSNAFNKKFNSKNKAQQISFCKTLWRDIKKSNFDVSKKLPSESKLLREIFLARGAQPNFIRDSNIRSGCAKGYYNNGDRDIELIDLACNCFMDTLVAKGTSTEIDEWISSRNPSDITTLPWAKGLTEEVQHCAQQH